MPGTVLAVALSIVTPSPAGQGPGCDTLLIDTIIVENSGTTAAATGLSGMLDRVTGALHVTTRAGVIRRALVLGPGDCHDPPRVAESERALWALNVFRSVRLDTLRLPASGPDSLGRFALRVVTADGWSARPVWDFSRAASRTTWELGAIEQNFLGTATQLYLVYRSTPDRGALTASYYDPDFIVRKAILWASHSSLSNGTSTGFTLGLPFRETAARTALLVSGGVSAEQLIAFGPTSTLTHSRGRYEWAAMSAGVALHASSQGYTRLWLGANWRAQGWSPALTGPLQTNRHAAPGVALEFARVRYRTTQRFNTLGRQEWVDLSNRMRVGLWAAPRAWGYAASRAGLGLELRGQIGLINTTRGHVVFRFDGTGGWAGRRAVFDSGQVRARLTVVAQPARRHTLVLYGDAGTMLGPHYPGAYDIWWERRGPRLFPPHSFIGPRMWSVSAEHRLLVTESLAGLIGVGVAPFLDWIEVSSPGGAVTTGGNVGLALRLAPLRMASSEVTEFVVGRRVGRGLGPVGMELGIRKAVLF